MSRISSAPAASAALAEIDAHTPTSVDLYRKIVCIENAGSGLRLIFTSRPCALVTAFGGANSHMAIRCAELGLPAAIGCGEQTYLRLRQAGAAEIDCAARMRGRCMAAEIDVSCAWASACAWCKANMASSAMPWRTTGIVSCARRCRTQCGVRSRILTRRARLRRCVRLNALILSGGDDFGVCATTPSRRCWSMPGTELAGARRVPGRSCCGVISVVPWPISLACGHAPSRALRAGLAGSGGGGESTPIIAGDWMRRPGRLPCTWSGGRSRVRSKR
ncbi:MAG: hypothetical protein KIS79_02095 [Burkholderiales bacterium]|nr:hypothetical protein [Burkholderiales bacterium]